MVVRILYVSANPEGTDNVRLDEELRNIQKEIDSSEFRDQLDFKAVTATRVVDLVRALTDFRPDVVHFSGHGGSNGDYILLDHDDLPKPITPEQMAKLFVAVGDNLKLGFFNHCFSQAQAAAVAELVSCCISITDKIDDLSSNLFAAELYRAIAAGRSLKHSFSIARECVRMTYDDQEADAFQIVARNGINPAEIFLVSNGSSGSKLELMWEPDPCNGSFHIVFGARNAGKQIARHPAIRFRSAPGFNVGALQNMTPYENGPYRVCPEGYNESTLVRGVGDQIIHAGAAQPMARYDTRWWFKKQFIEFTCDYELLWECGSTPGILRITKELFCERGNIKD